MGREHVEYCAIPPVFIRLAFSFFFWRVGWRVGGQPLIKQTALERQEIEVRQAAAARRLWLKETLSYFN